MYESLLITSTTKLSLYGHFPKESIEEHYEYYQRLTLVLVVRLSDRKGEKKESEQYYEGVTVVSLVMCSRWNGWRRKLICFGCAGVRGTAAPNAPDMR